MGSTSLIAALLGGWSGMTNYKQWQAEEDRKKENQELARKQHQLYADQFAFSKEREKADEAARMRSEERERLSTYQRTHKPGSTFDPAMKAIADKHGMGELFVTPAVPNMPMQTQMGGGSATMETPKPVYTGTQDQLYQQDVMERNARSSQQDKEQGARRQEILQALKSGGVQAAEARMTELGGHTEDSAWFNSLSIVKNYYDDRNFQQQEKLAGLYRGGGQSTGELAEARRLAIEAARDKSLYRAAEKYFAQYGYVAPEQGVALDPLQARRNEISRQAALRAANDELVKSGEFPKGYNSSLVLAPQPYTEVNAQTRLNNFIVGVLGGQVTPDSLNALEKFMATADGQQKAIMVWGVDPNDVQAWVKNRQAALRPKRAAVQSQNSFSQK